MRTYKPFKQILPITVSIALIFGTLACNKSNKKSSSGSEAVTNSETTVNATTESSDSEDVYPDFESNVDAVKIDELKSQNGGNKGVRDYYGLSFDFDKFYCNPNYDIALDSFSFEELRMLRSIPYARNGHWFKEGEICEKLVTIKQYIEDLKPVVKQYAQDSLNKRRSEYWKLWDTNYTKTYSLISLNDEEQAFVKRVDECIAEFEKLRYIDVDGVILPNSQLLYNKSYVDIADDKFWNNLQKQDFAISNDQYNQLFNPYELYDHLPVYVTTDLYLHTYHMYFSWLLKQLETEHFLPAMLELCNRMYDLSLKGAEKAQNPTEKSLAEAAATFYAIAIKLASDKDVAKVPESMKDFYDGELSNIMAEADGESSFMGTKFAYSLFKPRGNYTRSEEGKRYFKSMMWLQTARFSMQQTLYLAYQFKLASNEIKKSYFSVCDAITFLMGEPDNVSIAEIADILDSGLGITSVADICNQQIVNEAENTIAQKFANHAKIDPSVNVVVNFMPQRYVPDNEVLGTMYDSVPNADRAYPNGLDVFDAFGSTTAANILDSTDSSIKDMDKKRAEMRELFTDYTHFDKTMYNKWFESLVALQKKDKKCPGHMKTSAWELKNMNASLGSWAELKHDAILYAKQPGVAEMGGDDWDDEYSYIYLPAPEFFQNYLEPNIQFWEKLKEMLTLNIDMLKKAGFYDKLFESQTQELMEDVDFCISISKLELKGVKLSPSENYRLSHIGGRIERMTLSYLNSDDDNSLESWYDVKGPDAYVAVVADVFTRSIEGCNKNGILYAATAKANTIYVVVERNNQIYLTRGGVYDYREFIGPLGNRLTDEEWQAELPSNPTKGRPYWTKDLYTEKQIKINKKTGERYFRPHWAVHNYMENGVEKHELMGDSAYNKSFYY